MVSGLPGGGGSAVYAYTTQESCVISEVPFTVHSVHFRGGQNIIILTVKTP